MHPDDVADLRGIHIGANRRDSARNLVTGDQGRVRTRLHLVEEVEVRPADSRREDLYEDVLRPGLRIWHLDQFRHSIGFESDCVHIPY